MGFALTPSHYELFVWSDERTTGRKYGQVSRQISSFQRIIQRVHSLLRNQAMNINLIGS